ncbi:MAG: D-glycerate dehydrogenase [Candidatus Paceibacterota bacterium]|jgi:lactate dehydrogenase-like 2-hydroxyacid dehydrogenase
MNKRVFITRQIPDIAVEMLRGKGYSVEIYPKDKVIPRRELIKTLHGGQYDAVLSLLTDTIDAELFNAAPSVKLYANYATGFDNIDLVEAKKRGIIATNAPAELSSEAVAEHTMALVMALATRLVEANDFVRAGRYEGWAPMNFVGTDFHGKTIGLVGTGHIGARVASFASALGMKVIYTDVVRNERLEKECSAIYCASIEELLPKADFVSLHVPLLDSTRHLMNEKRLRLMKPTAFLVNTARGAVIDEMALEIALRDKVIRAAALDVFEFEPKISKGLRRLPNVILTPHIASASIEARNQMAQIAAQNIVDFFEGRTPRNIVNP